MRLSVLYSGGKDSTYAGCLGEIMGHEVEKLLVTEPPEDSLLFHHPNVEKTVFQARAWGKEIEFVRGDGEEALEAMIGKSGDGVITGALASDYQYFRIAGVAGTLGKSVIAPLWHRDPEEVLREMVGFGVEFVITAVGGLGSEWLGRRINKGNVGEFIRACGEYGVNPAGEGGEYESFALSSPCWRYSLEVEGEVEKEGDVEGIFRITRVTPRIP